MFTLFWSLYANASDGVVEKIWKDKADALRPVVVETAKGPVTVRRGWTFSSKEESGLLMLPYLDDKLVRQIIRNNQAARTNYSADNKIPGLFSPTHIPVASNDEAVGYEGRLGVQNAGTETIPREDIVTPSAAAPVILMDQAVGSAWLLNMLKGPKMQGPFGALDAANTKGTEIAPLHTWVGMMTTVLSLTGGISDLVRARLKADKKYDRFKTLIQDLYKGAFSEPLKGTNVSLALPTSSIPKAMRDFIPPCQNCAGH